MTIRRIERWAVQVLLLVLLSASSTVAAEPLRIGGKTGISALLHTLGAQFQALSGSEVRIIPGLGGTAAMSALADGALDMVVLGRALAVSEAGHDRTRTLEVCTPFVFASSHPVPDALDSARLSSLHAETSPHWRDGTPLRIILRMRHVSDNITVMALFPGMEAAIAQARLRDSVPVAMSDQDNVDLAVHMPGSLIATTLTQIILERPALRLVAINGVMPSLETYENGQYPYDKRLYFVVPGRSVPVAHQYLDFLRSPEARRTMRDAGVTSCAPSPMKQTP